jgi:hypothetical protein
MQRILLLLAVLALVAGHDTLQAVQRGGRGGGFNAGGAYRGGDFSAGNTQRPANVQHPAASRPNFSMQRPAVSVPQTLNRSVAGVGQGSFNRPMTLPSQPLRSSPSVISRPGGFNPGASNSATRFPTATQRPSFPAESGIIRPTQPATSLPGVTARNRLPTGAGNLPKIDGITRPATGAPRPTPGGLGDFLGMDRPLQPSTRPGTLPATRPGTDIARPGGIIRPGGDNRPSTRPAPITNRPIINRPVNVGNQVNTTINRRPSWANINNNTIHTIHNQWNNALVNRPMNNWWRNNPRRYNYWNGWANGVRSNWRYWHGGNWFGPNWWHTHHFAYPGWHYHWWFPYYPYTYWWSVPNWAGLTSWFTWNVNPLPVWSTPIVYDYGPGGNVYYQDGSVFLAGQPISSAADFAESAAALATVAPPPSEDAAAQAEWMPLGTFALSTGEKDTEPSRVLQLAVTKDGIIGGTLYNNQTDQTQSIQGQVDKETQRVAFRIGDRESIVAETGLYNLTQKEAPLLVHFGTLKTENYLLIRLENPEYAKERPDTNNPLP